MLNNFRESFIISTVVLFFGVGVLSIISDSIKPTYKNPTVAVYRNAHRWDRNSRFRKWTAVEISQHAQTSLIFFSLWDFNWSPTLQIRRNTKRVFVKPCCNLLLNENARLLTDVTPKSEEGADKQQDIMSVYTMMLDRCSLSHTGKIHYESM